MRKVKTLSIMLFVVLTLATSSTAMAKRGRGHASCCKMKHCCYESKACCRKSNHACCNGQHVKGGCCCKKGSCPMPHSEPGTGTDSGTITGGGF